MQTNSVVRARVDEEYSSRTLRFACEDLRIFHLGHFDAVGLSGSAFNQPPPQRYP